MLDEAQRIMEISESDPMSEDEQTEMIELSFTLASHVVDLMQGFDLVQEWRRITKLPNGETSPSLISHWYDDENIVEMLMSRDSTDENGFTSTGFQFVKQTRWVSKATDVV
jgi:hypothetical protein